MLKIENLCFSYSRRRELIHNLSLQLQPGTICGLLGKNGVGKSTLIYLISGLLRPCSGRVEFDGFTPIRREIDFLRDVFLVPEEFSLPAISIEKYESVNAPFYPNFDRNRFRELLNLFELDIKMNLGQVSMGQKKKAFLSFAMACNTRLLILDEPTNGLDISAKRNFRKAIANCMTDEKYIMISTHQVNDIDKILDHVVIMDNSGFLLDSSYAEINSKYRFNFTTDKERALNALLYLDVPGGYNIIEPLQNPDEETEINLETLFEFITQKGKQ